MDLVRESLGITIVFGLLWVALWLLKRKGALQVGPRAKKGNGRGCIEVIDKLRLTPQHSLHVIRIGEREIVLGVHGSGFTVLTESVASTDNGDVVERARAAGTG